MKCETASDMKQEDIFLAYYRQTFACLQDVFSVTIYPLPRHAITRLPRRLEDVLKKSWKMRNCCDLEKPFPNFNKKNGNNNHEDK